MNAFDATFRGQDCTELLIRGFCWKLVVREERVPACSVKKVRPSINLEHIHDRVIQFSDGDDQQKDIARVMRAKAVLLEIAATRWFEF